MAPASALEHVLVRADAAQNLNVVPTAPSRNWRGISFAKSRATAALRSSCAPYERLVALMGCSFTSTMSLNPARWSISS